MKSLGNILAGMVVGMLVVVSGCNATGNAFARSLVSTAAHQAVVSGVQNEIEGPRGTTVNVVQGQGSNSTAQSRYYDGKLPDGSHFKGEVFNNQAHGLGLWACSNGVFVGEYRSGSAYKGTFTDKDGTIIIGVFTGETKSGTIVYPDGRKYEGEWSGDVRWNPAVWVCERPHGIGKMTHPDGKIEEGIWRNGKFLGKLVK